MCALLDSGVLIGELLEHHYDQLMYSCTEIKPGVYILCLDIGRNIAISVSMVVDVRSMAYLLYRIHFLYCLSSTLQILVQTIFDK